VEGHHLRQELQEIVGRKWDLEVLAHLSERPSRYMDLVREIRASGGGISESVLSKTLRHLVADGLIRRETADGNHVAYTVTTRGQRIATLIAQLTGDGDG
jgi:DNA-binding HxlR family transcriptional regulator